MNEVKKAQITALSLKGFTKDEISKLLEINVKDIPDRKKDIVQDSNDLYGELQKDLAKLVLKEMSNPNRDSSVVLSSIKLQAELQEKKLALTRRITPEKISKGYIHDRDKEIKKMKDEKVSEEEIAKKFKISRASINQSLDRVNLNLPDELLEVSPSIISETIGLGDKTRLDIIRQAYNQNLTRGKVREIVKGLKNK